MDQKLNIYAKVHEVVTLQHEFRSTLTRSEPKVQVKEDLTSLEDILPGYQSRKLTLYFDVEVARLDCDIGPPVPGLTPIIPSYSRFAKVVDTGDIG